MDSSPVNWEALDALIIDFVTSENLFEDASTDSSPSPLSSPSSSSSPSISSSSYHARLIIRRIRSSIESGDIENAIDILRSHAPFVLDDHRILFILHKQKFIELLRKGTHEDRVAAIACLRTSVAPCALGAYPEAYEEFKHVLLALIYDKSDQTSPVAKEWAEKRRYEIAGLMSSALRASLQAYDPLFSMTLRYLISLLWTPKVLWLLMGLTLLLLMVVYQWKMLVLKKMGLILAKLWMILQKVRMRIREIVPLWMHLNNLRR